MRGIDSIPLETPRSECELGVGDPATTTGTVVRLLGTVSRAENDVHSCQPGFVLLCRYKYAEVFSHLVPY